MNVVLMVLSQIRDCVLHAVWNMEHASQEEGVIFILFVFWFCFLFFPVQTFPSKPIQNEACSFQKSAYLGHSPTLTIDVG